MSTPIAMPKVGEYWEGQGGIRIAECPGQNGEPSYHLIMAVGDDANLGELAWGSYGVEVAGANSEWDGLANTRALLAQDDAATKHPAAFAASQFTKDGHTDFYLAARFELAACQVFGRAHAKAGWHWSSTQSSADYAFDQHFSDGYQHNHPQYGECWVRPVRRLPIQ